MAQKGRGGSPEAYSATVIKAEADGIGPAIRVAPTSKDSTSPEYLFNVPEGFSRLTLEHRVRPSRRLRAVFLTSLHPSAAGSLGSLLLRLAQDGHGELEVNGPVGSAGLAHGLRHIFRWSHPKVLVAEVEAAASTAKAYEDEHVVVFPLFGGLPAPCLACLVAHYSPTVSCDLRPANTACKEAEVETLHSASTSSSASSGGASGGDSDDACSLRSDKSEASCSLEEKVNSPPSYGRETDGHCQIEEDGEGRLSGGRKRRRGEVLCSKQASGTTADMLAATRGHDKPPLEDSRNALFSSFDELFTQKAGKRNLRLAFEGKVKRQPGATGRPLDSGASAPVGASTSSVGPRPHVQNHNVQLGAVKHLYTADIAAPQRRTQQAVTPGSRTIVKKMEGVGHCIASCRSGYWLGPSSEGLLRGGDEGHPALQPGANPVYIRHGCSTWSPIEGLHSTRHLATGLPGNTSEDMLLGRAKQAELLSQDLQPLQCSKRRLLGYLLLMKRLCRVLLVVDCQSSEGVMELERLTRNWQRQGPGGHRQSREALEDLQGIGMALAGVIHLTKAVVSDTLEYRQWMAGLSPNVTHLLLQGDSLPRFGFLASLKTSALLNLVSPEVFPLPAQYRAPTSEARERARLSLAGGEGDGRSNIAMQASTLIQEHRDIRLLTRMAVLEDASSAAVPLDFSLCPEETTAAKVQQEIKAASPAWLSEAKVLGSTAYPLAHLPHQEPFELVFLGTGSAEPSKHRASSCILLTVPQSGSSILLDCGGGTLGQMKRFLGETGARDVLQQLRGIWVSHKHADHSSGVLEVVIARGPGPPLLVIAPRAVELWLLEATEALQTSGVAVPRFNVIPCSASKASQQSLQHTRHPEASGGALYLSLLASLGLSSIQSVPVEHCHDAWGVVVRSLRGWSFVYSGDTRPCKRLVAAGQGCTLLIHEATYESGDALVALARQNRHSMVREALQVGKEMRAKHVILTHFSQRHPKAIDFEVEAIPDNVSVAFDGMRVTSSSLPKLSAITRIAAKALSNDIAEGKNEDRCIVAALSTCDARQIGGQIGKDGSQGVANGNQVAEGYISVAGTVECLKQEHASLPAADAVLQDHAFCPTISCRSLDVHVARRALTKEDHALRRSCVQSCGRHTRFSGGDEDDP